VRLLLDTCAFLWWLGEPEKLPPKVKAAIGDSGNDIVLSAVSGWEMALKHRLGRLDLLAAPADIIAAALAAQAVVVLPIGMAHAVRGGDLPLHHKDPFDRLLIAQAEIEGLALLTPDPAFAPYGVKTIW
jgi:PIN domain nuclease of toxin-antitoxin system